VVARILNGDLNPPYVGKGGSYGFGPLRQYMSGLPHFEKTEFKGEFPLAEIKFIDEMIPLDIKLKAFNPFVPLNDKDSSIPATIFIFEVKNTYDKELNISLVANLSNPSGRGSINKYFDKGSYQGIKLYSNFYQENDPEYGDITLSTDGKDISWQSYWYRGKFFDNLTMFWEDFTTPGHFKERIYEQPEDLNREDVASLCVHKTLKPGETEEFKFVLTWNFPNFVNYWNPGKCPNGKKPQWKNYYATIFKDSTKSAKYVWANFERLYRETLEFKNTLFCTTVPDQILDAISSNLSVLKSPTCIRLTDGTLYGFEGCRPQSGCCEGSCTHVWNYAQAVPFLFPSLERGMREIDYKYNQFENGKMAFRMMLPPTREKSNFRAAADGQMGGVIKTYREWKISGDIQWLRKLWPRVKKALEYAWHSTNEDWWDKDYDGERRNPWNEFECGSNYARSMASYSLLLALSGFEYDMTKGHIGFSPKINRENFYCFWSLNTGWGSFEIQENRVQFTVKSGYIFLNSFMCDVFKTKQIEVITVGDREVSFIVKDGCVRFESTITIKADDVLCAIVK